MSTLSGSSSCGNQAAMMVADLVAGAVTMSGLTGAETAKAGRLTEIDNSKAAGWTEAETG